jgi:hypothetical protein
VHDSSAVVVHVLTECVLCVWELHRVMEYSLECVVPDGEEYNVSLIPFSVSLHSHSELSIGEGRRKQSHWISSVAGMCQCPLLESCTSREYSLAGNRHRFLCDSSSARPFITSNPTTCQKTLVSP